MLMTTVIVTDRKAGHENRSLAVARALGCSEPRRVTLTDKVREIGPALARVRALALARRRLGEQQARRLMLDYTDLHEVGLASLRRTVPPAWVVATGTPPCVFALVLAAATGARSAVGGLRPAGALYRRFDLAVLPFYQLHVGAHDANVVRTSLPAAYHDGTVDPAVRDDAPRWLLALGGPSDQRPWHGEFIRRQLEVLIETATRHGTALRITWSRRTPTGFLRWLGTRIANWSAQEFAPPDARFSDLLEAADKVLVTEDSESMLAEAINAGHCPGVLAVAPRATRPDHRLIERLEDWRLITRRLHFGFAVRFAERRGLAQLLRDADAVRAFGDAPAARTERNWLYAELCAELDRRGPAARAAAPKATGYEPVDDCR